jgi:hypothetical protein
MHPPKLLICAALGRLPNVEGARPTLFSAYRPNSRLYALASLLALAAGVRHVLLRLLARLGVDHEPA